MQGVGLEDRLTDIFIGRLFNARERETSTAIEAITTMNAQTLGSTLT